MTKFEHATVVLKFEKKSYAATRSDVLQGLAKESATALGKLGDDGWELVSVLPFVSGSAFLARPSGTDAAMGFFKRAKA